MGAPTREAPAPRRARAARRQAPRADAVLITADTDPAVVTAALVGVGSEESRAQRQSSDSLFRGGDPHWEKSKWEEKSKDPLGAVSSAVAQWQARGLMSADHPRKGSDMP